MKVVCVQLISPVDGKPMAETAWVKLDAEYPVLSVLAAPAGRVQVQILTEDGRSAGWFDAAMFMTSDSSVPSNWVVSIGECGEFELGPARWAAPGYWESFYDGDPQARVIFAEELSVILATAASAP
jgi:hypothetical protein